VILLLHHRYRHPGGEERAVEDIAWLVRERLGEDVELLTRDSAALGGAAAAGALLAGGLRPEEVAAAVRRTGARVVHAHNVNPTFGWRALAAARAAGARVVLHLHNYRLVCAVGTCFTRGADCTRCHGRDTWPGVRLNCRGGSPAESLAYAAGLALWQRRLAGAADAVLVPSAFALGRLRELGAPLPADARVLGSVQRAFADRSAAAAGRYVLAAGRLTPEKGFADAVAACAQAGLPLVVAGEGPELPALRARAAAADVRFAGRVPAEELAALEAMAAGLPVVAARAGGLAEAVPEEGLYAPGDVAGLAVRLRALWGDASAGERALARARARWAPGVVAAGLRDVYAATSPAGA
jgi:glycosyltransferase involved in cell wall biosynthesis